MCVGLVLLFIDDLTLPHRYGGDSSTISPPITWFVAAMPIGFAGAIILNLIGGERYQKVSAALSAVGLASAFLGLVIIGPLLGN
jgi:hypothetical protein